MLKTATTTIDLENPLGRELGPLPVNLVALLDPPATQAPLHPPTQDNRPKMMTTQPLEPDQHLEVPQGTRLAQAKATHPKDLKVSDRVRHLVDFNNKDLPVDRLLALDSKGKLVAIHKEDRLDNQVEHLVSRRAVAKPDTSREDKLDSPQEDINKVARLVNHLECLDKLEPEVDRLLEDSVRQELVVDHQPGALDNKEQDSGVTKEASPVKTTQDKPAQEVLLVLVHQAVTTPEHMRVVTTQPFLENPTVTTPSSLRSLRRPSDVMLRLTRATTPMSRLAVKSSTSAPTTGPLTSFAPMVPSFPSKSSSAFGGTSSIAILRLVFTNLMQISTITP